MLVVVSGGNGGLLMDTIDVYPMSYAKQNEAIVAVVAVDGDDELAYFSNRGSQLVWMERRVVGSCDGVSGHSKDPG